MARRQLRVSAHRAWALAGVVFMAMVATITCAVHWSILLLGSEPAFAAEPWARWVFAFQWPSVVYALDVLAWDVFFPLAAASAALALRHAAVPPAVRGLLWGSAGLALTGLAGVPLADMQVRNIGIVERLEHGISVADIGTGSGHAVNVMARAFPKSNFVGIDFSESALEIGRAEATDWGLDNATFISADAAQLTGDDTYDFITTFDAVHDQAHPQDMVDGIYRSLRPGGFWLCADVRASSHVGENMDHPMGTFMYSVSCQHCMTVSLAYEGDGLGAMWGVQKAKDVFGQAGFAEISVKTIDFDPTNNYYVCRKPD